MESLLINLCKYLEETLEDEDAIKLVYKDAIMESIEDIDSEIIYMLSTEFPLFAEAYRELTEE